MELKTKTYQKCDVNAAHSVVVSEALAETERSSCVCDDRAQPVAFRLPLLFPSLSLSLTHTLSPSLSPSLCPPEIIVYFDSQTLPLSRDPTLQIYSTFFTSHRMPEGRENRVQKA